MRLSTPSSEDRYAVASAPDGTGPAAVSFWRDQSTIISLMTRYANCEFSSSQGFSVWHRRTATSQWKLITSPT